MITKIKKIIYVFLICIAFLAVLVSSYSASELNPDYLFAKKYTQNERLNEINPAPLLTRGKILYESGYYRQAIAVLQQAAESYQNNGDILGEALSRRYLANAYQDLGEWELAKQAISTSLFLLNNLEELTQQAWQIFAQAWNTQGNIQLATGDPSGALETWQKAKEAYAHVNNKIGIVGSQINQAQALQQLGMYRRSQRLLITVNQTLQQMPLSPMKALGLRSFGISLQNMGDFDRSQTVLEESLGIFKQLEANNVRESDQISATLIALGHNARELQQPEIAFEYYQQAAAKATTAIGQVEAQLNELSILVKTQQWSAAIGLLPTIQSHLENLPLSRFFVDARVNFSSSSIKILQLQANSNQPPFNSSLVNLKQVAQILAQAVQAARNLKDIRAESYALRQLGYLYEQTTQWSEARQITEQAIIQAQGIQARDILATAHWQLGRIFKHQGNTAGAIAAYTEAFTMLQSLRSDLVATNSQLQFSFQDTIEPIYRELVALLLEASKSPENPSPKVRIDQQKNLKHARQIIEALQLAELDNFFRNTCVKVRREQIDRVDPRAAVIYPIILPDRLATILSLPGQPLRHYETDVSANQVESVLDNWLQSLNPVFNNKQRLQISQQVYNWLIQPAEADFAASDVETLVFVLDGSLRNLPMAALYDGTQYLIEKYSIALTPGLQLLEPRSLIREKLQVLSAGLTQPRQGFKSLPGVELELNQIAAEVESEIILDADFTEANLKSKIDRHSFPILHLATHGQFSSNAKQTFLLTWDGKIDVQELNELLQSNPRNIVNPIELLVLSACQTALGDKRAALGLAGVAVRSGARSTLATLWSVQDESTAILITEFYRALAKDEVSKAEALRISQIALLKNSRFQHPYYWSPFVLVGNWL